MCNYLKKLLTRLFFSIYIICSIQINLNKLCEILKTKDLVKESENLLFFCVETTIKK